MFFKAQYFSQNQRRLNKSALWAGIAVLTLAGGCQSYQTNPFERDSLYHATCQIRTETVGEPDSVLTFETLARTMSIRSPELRKIQAEYVAYGSVAELWPPYPNPSIEGGILNFHNAGASPWNVGPYVSLGFSIPLARRIYWNDCLNREEAVRSYQRITLEHRTLYLSLREQYILSVLYSRKSDLVQEILDLSEQCLFHANELRQTDSSAETDISVYEAERASRKLELCDALRDRTEAIAGLSKRVGVAFDTIWNRTLQDLPDCPTIKLPKETADSILIENNPDLAAIEADNRVHDAEYRHELSRQLPDLVIGSNYAADEARVQVVGFTAGWEMPVFDHNQQAIAASHANRNATLKVYQSLLNDKLTEKERLLSQMTYTLQKIFVLDSELISGSKAAADAGEMRLKSGELSGLDEVILQRIYRDQCLQRLNCEIEYWQYLTQLEQTLGWPILFWEKEGAHWVPPVDPTPFKTLYPDSGDPGYLWGLF